MSLKDSAVVFTASVRFFRSGEDEFEYLWKDELNTLLQYAEMIPTNMFGLGSTRIIWNQSKK